MNRLKWVWKVLFCKHDWRKTVTAMWNENHKSKSEPSERLAFCSKCPMAIRVKEWKEVGL